MVQSPFESDNEGPENGPMGGAAQSADQSGDGDHHVNGGDDGDGDAGFGSSSLDEPRRFAPYNRPSTKPTFVVEDLTLEELQKELMARHETASGSRDILIARLYQVVLFSLLFALSVY